MLHLILTMAGRRLALDCAGVDAVIDVGAIVPTPLAERQVVGVTALRSRVVTVIDPTRVLAECDADTPPGRAVVTSLGGHSYAVLAGHIDDAVALDRRPVPPGLALGSGWARVATGVVEHDGEVLLVVDPAALVAGRGRAVEFTGIAA